MAPSSRNPSTLRATEPRLAGEIASPAEAAGWRVWISHPLVHLALLGLIAAHFLWISWRKWPDAIVDFGRELYTPWRLTQGAVLYRDVDDFYGPLSQYVNAGLFRAFGSGMMVLVTANLLVFSAIVALIYFLVRRAWGASAAFCSLVVFISVFAFSRFSPVGNFNYATPYAHETTHGMLVLLLLVAALMRWLTRPGIWLSAFIGFLFGLTLVLKPEFMFAAAAVIGAAGLLARRRMSFRFSWLLAAAGAAMVPTVAFAGYFSRHVDAAAAWAYAGRAWLSVIATTRYIGDPAQSNYTGFDHALLNARLHVVATVTALAVMSVLGLVAWQIEKRRGSRWTFPAGLAVIGAFFVFSGTLTSTFWMQSGRCFLGLTLGYLVWLVLAWRRGNSGVEESRAWARILITVAAVSLMARMALNGRIYHFGYYQAALAAIVIVAGLLAEFPRRVVSQAFPRRMMVACILFILASGAMNLSRVSRLNYGKLRTPMGEGRDRFYTHDVLQPLAVIAAQFRSAKPGSTLLVLPEGLMLNYLPRLVNPLAPFFYYSAVTEGGREKQLVTQLAANPPSYVITLPRLLTEYGIQTYGERSGAGKDLMEWVAANYEGAPGDPSPIIYQTNAFQVLGLKAGVAAGRGSK